MKTPNSTLSGQPSPIETLRQQAETLRENIAAHEPADAKRAGTAAPEETRRREPELSARWWSPISRAIYEGLHRSQGQSEATQAFERSLQDSRLLLQPLEGFLRSWDRLTPAAHIESRFDVEIHQRDLTLMGARSVRRMIEAVGPDMAKQFPLAQLDLIITRLEVEIGQLRDKAAAAVRPKVQPPPLTPLSAPAYAAPAQSSGPTGPLGREPVIESLAKVPDLSAAAKEIGQSLGLPGLERDISAAAARLDGVSRERFEGAMRGLAVLSDFAIGSLDYRRVGAQFTGPGSPGCDRADHRSRNYSQRWVQDSAARQAESKRGLGEAITAALREEDAAKGAEGALVQGFLREIGLTQSEIEGWSPKAEAIRSALDGEAFVPLRAILELLPNRFSGRYSPDHIDGMKQAARQIARAVVEGRYPDALLDDPRNQAQLALIPGGAERSSWLKGHTTEGKGSAGQKVSTHEAQGLERFWATKIGGPSHGFDNMTHCVLSILGNVRTKAIVVDDESWPQPAARAYLRLLGNDRGRPMLYVEDPQIDFKLRGTGRADLGAISERVVVHAIERAKELGADLVVSDLLRGALDRIGQPYRRYEGNIVLEPSAVVSEASDSMLGHDRPQTERIVARSSFPFVEVTL